MKTLKAALRVKIAASGVLALVAAVCWVVCGAFWVTLVDFETSNAPEPSPGADPDVSIAAVYTDYLFRIDGDGIELARTVSDDRFDPAEFFVPPPDWGRPMGHDKFRDNVHVDIDTVAGKVFVADISGTNATPMEVDVEGDLITIGPSQFNMHVIQVFPSWWPIVTLLAIPWLVHLPFAVRSWRRRLKP